jgi:hypothetical protein
MRIEFEAALGKVLPACECSIRVVARRALRKVTFKPSPIKLLCKTASSSRLHALTIELPPRIASAPRLHAHAR